MDTKKYQIVMVDKTIAEVLGKKYQQGAEALELEGFVFVSDLFKRKKGDLGRMRGVSAQAYSCIATHILTGGEISNP